MPESKCRRRSCRRRSRPWRVRRSCRLSYGPGAYLTGSAIVAAIPPANNPTPKAVATTPKTRAAIWTQVVLVALRSDGEWFGVAWFSICAGMDVVRVVTASPAKASLDCRASESAPPASLCGALSKIASSLASKYGRKRERAKRCSCTILPRTASGRSLRRVAVRLASRRTRCRRCKGRSRALCFPAVRLPVPEPCRPAYLRRPRPRSGAGTPVPVVPGRNPSIPPGRLNPAEHYSA